MIYVLLGAINGFAFGFSLGAVANGRSEMKYVCMALFLVQVLLGAAIIK